MQRILIGRSFNPDDGGSEGLLNVGLQGHSDIADRQKRLHCIIMPIYKSDNKTLLLPTWNIAFHKVNSIRKRNYWQSLVWILTQSISYKSRYSPSARYWRRNGTKMGQCMSCHAAWISSINLFNFSLSNLCPSSCDHLLSLSSSNISALSWLNSWFKGLIPLRFACVIYSVPFLFFITAQILLASKCIIGSYDICTIQLSYWILFP